MDVLDDQGHLFGRVNIVDALVGLVAIALVIAGVALVYGGPSDEPRDTMHVTLVSENTSATALEPADVTLQSGTQAGGRRGATATVTDVHRTAGPRVYLRVALDGTRTDDAFRFNGEPVRLGDTVVVANNLTRATTHVVERDVDPTFAGTTTTVTLEATVRRPVAEAVAAGDEVTVGPSTVATVNDAGTTRENDTHSHLTVTVALETRVLDSNPYYAGRPVRLGRTIEVATADYGFEGEVVDRG
jgi:hypothetical protein